MITGYTFDRAKVTPMQDSTLYDFLNYGDNTVIPGIGSSMSVSVNGLTCTIAPGKAVVCGRVIEITVPQDVQIPASSTGYLCLTIDLSQTNTSSGTPGQTDYTFVINQVRAEFVTSLTQNNLFNGELIYNFPLGSVTSTATTASFTRNASSYMHSPATLYQNLNGTTGTITLADIYSNYSKIGIYYATDTSKDFCGYQEFSTAISAGTTLSVTYSNATQNGMLLQSKTVNFSGRIMSVGRYLNMNIYPTPNIYAPAENTLRVLKIMGYKH